MRARRIISLVVAVLALLAAVRVLLEAIFVLHEYYAVNGPEPHIALIECILLALTGVLLFEVYRFVKYFAKKPVNDR